MGNTPPWTFPTWVLPQVAVFQEKIAPVWVAHGVQVLPTNLLQRGHLSPQDHVSCQKPAPSWASCATTTSTSSSAGFSMGCSGTACLTVVFIMGCRAYSVSLPGEPPLILIGLLHSDLFSLNFQKIVSYCCYFKPCLALRWTWLIYLWQAHQTANHLYIYISSSHWLGRFWGPQGFLKKTACRQDHAPFPHHPELLPPCYSAFLRALPTLHVLPQLPWQLPSTALFHGPAAATCSHRWCPALRVVSHSHCCSCWFWHSHTECCCRLLCRCLNNSVVFAAAFPAVWMRSLSALRWFWSYIYSLVSHFLYIVPFYCC